jgi:HD-like signal output (HDOD) protein/ActR/RegA family two-component response regulator
MELTRNTAGPLRRVLFVDDEQQVLDGLQNLLRKQRKQWDMGFVLGGQAALSAFASAPYDVIVSDMRMPGMDGAELLAAVRDQYPATTRIVLSGHAERDAVQRALAVAHQFLSKPCDAEVLKVVVERVCGLHSLLGCPRLRQVVGRIDKLPSVPQVYLDLIAALDRPETTMPMISAIIERDPAMSAKVLQLVNSSYFGLARRLGSIGDAVSYLGSDLLRSLALSANVFARLAASPVPGFSIETLQDRAVLGGKLARALLAGDKKRADDAFTAALVRDLGAMVLALGIPATFAPVIAEHNATGTPLHEIESRVLGVTHAEVGAYLLGVWGLPTTIVEAVGHRHAPARITHDDRDVVAAVHVAAVVANTAPQKKPSVFDPALVAAMGPRFDEWKRRIAAELRKLDLSLVEA